MAEYGVNTQKLALAGLLGFVLTADVILGLTVVYYRYERGLETSARFTEPPAKLEALLAQQQTRLTDYRVIDREKGVVGIPIDRAMELVLTELAESQKGAPAADRDSGTGERP